MNITDLKSIAKKEVNAEINTQKIHSRDLKALAKKADIKTRKKNKRSAMQDNKRKIMDKTTFAENGEKCV